ncbi:MAG: DUF2142 domain-containing protein [Actinobacteria bacterium]|nr:MAG: DUF2142 domain-containing protein [Actinomycetota bacterium]
MNIQLKKSEKLLLTCILIIFALQSIFLVFAVPLWQGPDEAVHFDYIRHIAENRSLPNQNQTNVSRDIVKSMASNKFWFLQGKKSPTKNFLKTGSRPNYQSQHPPIYYSISAILYKIAPSMRLRAYLIRIFSTLIGLLTVFLTFLSVKTLFPKNKPLLLLSSIFIISIPNFIHIFSVITNDALFIGLFCLFSYLFIRYMQAPSYQLLALLTIVLAAGFLTKIFFAVAIVILACGSLILFYKNHRENVVNYDYLKSFSCVIAGFAVLISPWLIRNYLSYHSLMPPAKKNLLIYKNIFEIMFSSPVPKLMLRSFWSFYSVAPLNGLLYQFVLGYLLICLTGIGIYLYRCFADENNKIDESGILISFFCGFIVYFIFLLEFALKIASRVQGRYLFAFAVPLSIILSLGVLELFPSRWRMSAAKTISLVLVSFSFTTLFNYIFSLAGIL